MRRCRAAALAALLALAAAHPAPAQQAQPQPAQPQPAQPQPAQPQRQQRPPAQPQRAPAGGEGVDYVTRGNGPICPRDPCSWDVRNAATRERVVVGRIDVSALRLPQARASEFMLDLVEGRFVVRGTVVAGQQPTLRISRIVRVAPGTIATRSGLTGTP